MNLQEQINRIQEVMGLNEVRSGVIDFIKLNLPNVPNYVIKDLFYRMVDIRHKSDFVNILKLYKPFQWELKKDVDIDMDFFDEKTQRDLKNRIGGDTWDFIPKDEERHEIQKQKLETEGLSEPIIVMKFKDENGYELAEGWHRTVQMFKKYPEGYTYPNVYVGSYPGTKKDFDDVKRKLFRDYNEALGEPDSMDKYIDG